MRRTIPLLRGAKGHGWYYKFMEKGNEAFTVKNVPPKAFDWTAKPTPIYSHAPNANLRPKVYMDMRIEKEDIGRLTFELAYDITPITVTNFINLLPKYTNTKFYNIIKNVAIMGGDIAGDGQGNQSSFPGNRYFKDENFVIPHTSRGLLSMVSTGLLYSFTSSLTHSLPHSLTPSLNQGIDTNGSQFYISLNKNDQMNGRCVVFGRLIDGEETLKAIETVFTFKGAPARDVIVHSVGALEK